jgi:hypothetical protein
MFVVVHDAVDAARVPFHKHALQQILIRLREQHDILKATCDRIDLAGGETGKTWRCDRRS